MKKIIVSMTVLISTLFFAMPASSVAIHTTDVSGIWTAATPGSPSVSGIGTDTIKWGVPTYRNGQSGYHFEGYAPPSFEIEENTMFALGKFLHFNYPITGASLQTASLHVSTTLLINGVSKTIDSVFDFEHWETLNHPIGEICANGAANGVGLNYFGCADRVTFSRNEGASEEFVVGNMAYYLDISGFFYNRELATEFWTKEKRENEAFLGGLIKTRTFQVTEPSTLALFGLALLGFGARRRLRKCC
ncbi:THxN family PEP-CTERM protein [Marinobacter alexandrii]|jgi:hypothetical protein|uniref:THxN family PEP-CTERM protein n=1 Tax=Marinobacter alexandrii TaxID=2570351 RepID=UPI002ABD8A2A|nr:THxN family PEP-CTERM protein [Marinobacter alexandrii]